jgi:hypothetical protein
MAYIFHNIIDVMIIKNGKRIWGLRLCIRSYAKSAKNILIAVIVKEYGCAHIANEIYQRIEFSIHVIENH